MNTQFKFIKGNISEGINPKLVPINNQITQVPSTEFSPCWSSLNKEKTKSSDSDWVKMGKKQETSCVKSSASPSIAKIPPWGSVTAKIVKNQHEVNSSKSPECPPWGYVSTVKAKIFPNTNKTDEGKNVEWT